MADPKLEIPEFLTFKELRYGFDAVGKWYQVLKAGGLYGGGENNFRLLDVRIFTLTADKINKLALSALEDPWSSPYMAKFSKSIIIFRDIDDVETTSHHYTILNILQKNINIIKDLRCEFDFEVSPLKTLIPRGDNYDASIYFQGTLKKEGIEIEKASFGGYLKIANLVEAFKEVAKIREKIKNIYCREEMDYIKDETGKSIQNPNAKDMVTYELGDKELAEKSTGFFKRMGNGIRKWELGENKTSIVTNAYSYEIASVLSFIKLVQIPQNWEFKKDEKTGG